jgi:hypothetical protein
LREGSEYNGSFGVDEEDDAGIVGDKFLVLVSICSEFLVLVSI